MSCVGFDVTRCVVCERSDVPGFVLGYAPNSGYGTMFDTDFECSGSSAEVAYV